MNIKSYYELNTSQDEWLYCNEIENVIDYLEKIPDFLKMTNNFKWKWVSISVIQSIYGLCISNIAGSHPGNLSNNKDMNYFYENNEGKCFKSKIKKDEGFKSYVIEWETVNKNSIPELPFSEQDLINNALKEFDKPIISIWSAIARARDNVMWMNRFHGGSALVLSKEEIESLNFLCSEIRNDFMHFRSMQKSYHILSIKQSCINLIRPIEFLIFETGQLILEKVTKDKLRSCIDKVKTCLN